MADSKMLSGDELLRLSKGKRLLKVDMLGPALWNRFGANLNGRHCMKLAVKIEKDFQHLRYDRAWAVEPNPNDPNEVARHANLMAAIDPLLPRRVVEPLYALFRRNHLACVMLMQRLGKNTLDDDVPFNSALGNDALRKALEEGIWVEVWEYSVYEAHRESFLAMMAADNHDADESLAENELQVLNRLRDSLSMVQTAPRLGNSIEDAAILQVQKYSSSTWCRQELFKLMDAAKTTSPQVLTFLLQFHSQAVNPNRFYVVTNFFKKWARIEPSAQWLRTAVLAAQYLSDPLVPGETISTQGKCQGVSIKMPMLEKLAKWDKGEVMQLESALAEVAKAYDPVQQEGSDADHVAVKIAELGLFSRRQRSKFWLSTVRSHLVTMQIFFTKQRFTCVGSSRRKEPS